MLILFLSLTVSSSFNSLLYTTRLPLSGTPELKALRRPPAEVLTNLQPTSANCVSVRRCINGMSLGLASVRL